jgi:hypothetical protein
MFWFALLRGTRKTFYKHEASEWERFQRHDVISDETADAVGFEASQSRLTSRSDFEKNMNPLSGFFGAFGSFFFLSFFFSFPAHDNRLWPVFTLLLTFPS